MLQNRSFLVQHNLEEYSLGLFLQFLLIFTSKSYKHCFHHFETLEEICWHRTLVNTTGSVHVDPLVATAGVDDLGEEQACAQADVAPAASRRSQGRDGGCVVGPSHGGAEQHYVLLASKQFQQAVNSTPIYLYLQFF